MGHWHPAFLLPLLFSFCLGFQADASAQVASPAEATIALGLKIAKEVGISRGLAWKSGVDIGLYDIPTLRATLLEMMEKEWPRERAALDARSFKALGLIPADYDLHERMVALLSEQIAGFYDPQRKELRIIDRSKGATAAPARSDSKRAGPSEEDRIVMTHELVHALQDQHFDLEQLMSARRENDDRGLAASALIEGDATLAMLCSEELRPEALFASGKILLMTLSLLDGLSGFLPNTPEFKKAPPILRETLTFPYFGGAKFCMALGSEGRDFAGVDAALRDPPESTEQILHPEKWFAATRDRPLEITLPDLSERLDGARRRIAGNTLGEFGTKILLARLLRKKAEAAAAGWDGDRHELYAAEGLPDSLVWFTTWDTENDADEFQAGLATWLKRLRKDSGETPADWAPLLLQHDDGLADVIARRGLDVVLVLGTRRNLLAPVVRSLFEEASKSERDSQEAARVPR